MNRLSTFRRSGSLIVMIIFIVTVASAIGRLFGLGAASELAGYVALFGSIAAFAGPLRSDLRDLAIFGPLIVVATSVPRLLAPVLLLPTGCATRGTL